MEQNYVQRGYLHEDFRLFHLRGAMEESVDWHYHTFHKIIEFLGGESGYGVEGKQYLLQPGDLVLVPQGCIHRPEAEPNAPYERRILYLSPEFLRRAGGSCDLAACFDRAREEFRFVVHPADGTGGAQLAALEDESLRALTQELCGVIREVTGAETVAPDTHVLHDLGVDSMTYYAIFSAVSEHCGVALAMDAARPLFTPRDFAAEVLRERSAQA